MDLDRVDEQIIVALVDDARRSFADLGTQVGLSASAVKRRVDRLRNGGAITGGLGHLHGSGSRRRW